MSAQIAKSAISLACVPAGLCQEKKYRQNQEKNKNFNYRLCQEKKCLLPRLDFASVEEQVPRALGFDENDPTRCPLPGHIGLRGGIAWLELLGRPGREFVCDCLGRAAEWGDDSVWRSDYSRSLSDAYASVRTGQVIERGTKFSAGERLVATLLLAHEVGLLEPVSVPMTPLPDAATLQHPDAPLLEHAPTMGHAPTLAHADASTLKHETSLSRAAWEFFTLLAGLRLARMDPADALPMPFAYGLVGAYLGVGRRAAGDAINVLRAQHAIELVGRIGGDRSPYAYVPVMERSER